MPDITPIYSGNIQYDFGELTVGGDLLQNEQTQITGNATPDLRLLLTVKMVFDRNSYHSHVRLLSQQAYPKTPHNSDDPRRFG